MHFNFVDVLFVLRVTQTEENENKLIKDKQIKFSYVSLRTYKNGNQLI